MLLRAGASRDELRLASQEAAGLWEERHESNVHDSYGLHPDDYAIGPNGQIGGGGADEADAGTCAGRLGGGYGDEPQRGGGGGLGQPAYGGGDDDLSATWYPRAAGRR